MSSSIPPTGGFDGSEPCGQPDTGKPLSMAETTTFRGDDHPALVAAALACRVCLSGEVEWALEVGDFEGQVHCRCLNCGHRRVVSLTSDQTLRLSLHREEQLEVA